MKDQEFSFSKTQGYFDKSLSIRFLIGFFFVFFLFLFLHFRETYVDNLELGSIAKRYVVAQVDFSFPDEEATIILKQEAARNIGDVYRLGQEEIDARSTEFQKYITQDEAGSKRWGEIAEKSGFSNIALALNLVSTGLAQSRFTDIRTMQRIEDTPKEDLPIPYDYFFVFVPTAETLDGKLPAQFWNSLSKEVFSEQGVPLDVSNFVILYFEKLIWHFQEDDGIEYTLRKIVQNRIPERYTHVRAGERLIDQGERVTSRHLAMLLAMKEKVREKRNLLDPLSIAGSLLMTLIFLFIGVIYLRENHKDIFYSNRRLGLLVTILILNLLLAKATELILVKSPNQLIDLVRFPLFVPFGAILIASLLSLRMAAIATLFLTIVFTLTIGVETVPFLIVNVLTATIAILTVRSIRRRKEVFIVCAKAWVASLVVILAFDLYENKTVTLLFLSDMTSTFLFMMMTAVLVVGCLPILESIFQIMTDITLMEFMDPNNELLRRLTIEAPGTYQHSIVVGNLAEAAASAIGANALFCRVATLYHDIGKLANPQYFTENQLGGVDLHQLLTPLESTQVIIAHVSEGVAIGRKVGLPEQFIDIIKEHHGTTIVYYFYHKQIELEGGDKSKISEKAFRYSGPKPHTKESTIIMIADTLEAASRCIDVFNEETIISLVDTLIAQKSEDGQFDESPLTFEELGVVKVTLVKNLLAASHPRIKYPTHHPGEEG